MASRIRPCHAVLTIIFLYLIFHLYKLNTPPNGYHQWRESDTAAVSLNYFHEDMNPFHPRVNQRENREGITGMELPIFNYAAALMYHVSGPLHATHRLLTVLAGCLSLWTIYLVGRLLFSTWHGVAAVWALAWSPLFFFYGYKIMPDIWMLTFLLVSTYSYLKWRYSSNSWWLISASVMLWISACIKPLGLAVLIPFAIDIYREKGRGEFARGFVAGLLVIAGTVGWYLYGRSVNSTYQTPGFDLGDSLTTAPNASLAFMYLKKLFFQWPWEMWIGWTSVPLFVFGIFAIPKNKVILLSVWVAACYCALAVPIRHSVSHDYYSLPILIPLCLITSCGIKSLWERFRPARVLIVIALAITPAVTFARVSHRLEDVPEFDVIRKSANEVIPKESLVVVQESTTAIRLYQMNRHGFVIRNKQSIAAAEYGLTRGATFLVSEREYVNLADSLPQFDFRTRQRLGPLYCYELVVDSSQIKP